MGFIRLHSPSGPASNGSGQAGAERDKWSPPAFAARGTEASLTNLAPMQRFGHTRNWAREPKVGLSLQYSRVQIDAIGYELAPIVVSSEELEDRLSPVYKALRIAPGQLEALTGIAERRWWEESYTITEGAAAAAKNALSIADIQGRDVEVLIYAGVCREHFEPATACAVSDAVGVSQDAFVFDVSNACLGVLNGIIDIANRIELKQIRCGVVVACESAREIVGIAINRMLADPSMETFRDSIATLTGGSGAAAVVLTDGSFSAPAGRKLLGAAHKAAPEYHRLCRWGVMPSVSGLGDLILSPQRLETVIEQLMAPETIPSAIRELLSDERLPRAVARLLPAEKLPLVLTQFMSTDSVSVLRHGVELGVRTWGSFLINMGWAKDHVDKIICHQVGATHRDTILKELGIPPEKEYPTFRYLGNMGTVSVPLTAALAEQRQFLQTGDRVGFLGIGSGLNCLMLGFQW